MKVVVTGTRGIHDIMGGVEAHCENLCPILAREGVDITVVRRSSYVTDNLSEWNGVKLHNIPVPRKKTFEAIIHTWRAVNWAAANKADIVHINAVGPALLCPYARLRGLKVVFTHHGPDYDRQKWGRTAKFMLRLGERLGCRYADEVIVISKVIEDMIRSKYGRNRHVTLIPNGVPEPDFCTCAEWFDELGIENGRFVLGMSRFVPEKRLDDLVKAFEKTDLSARGYKLVLAGDADFEDEYSLYLKDLAKRHNVILTGFVSGKKLHSLLSQAALYVLPSSHEGLPISLLEAMSYKLPVVVSDIPANLEIGLKGNCYFHTGDIDGLAAALMLWVNAGRIEYDMNRYSWSGIAKKTAEIYRNCYERQDI